MKRISVIIALALAIVMGSSLRASAEFRWGPSLGLSVNHYKFKQDLLQVSNGIGGSAGVRGEMMFPGIGFGIEVGLFYEQKAGKVNFGEWEIWQGDYGRPNLMLHNIDIPVNLKFKWTRMQGLEDYVAPFVFGGPVFSIQAGHTKCDALKYSGGDIGLTVGGGAELFRHWQIAASYTWGMSYAMKTRLLTDNTAANRTVDIRVTYLF
ncbi:MAG: PorT family protein [Duncaniella sp.]|nr:PorT family protein [Duncaniella sp.]